MSTQIVSLNSSESLPIPIRVSSIPPPADRINGYQVQGSAVDGQQRIVPQSQLSRYSYNRPASPSTSGQTHSTFVHDTDSKSTKRQSGHSVSSFSGNTPVNMVSAGQLSGPGSPRVSHNRSNSLKRKPVPAYLPNPIPHPDLPADHPFNAPAPSLPQSGGNLRGKGFVHGNGRDSPLDTSGSEVGTPGLREDKDLFFAPQQVQSPQQPTSLPPPPRNFSKSSKRTLKDGRSPTSLVHSVTHAQSGTAAPTAAASQLIQNGLEERRSTFQGGLNINIPDSSMDDIDGRDYAASGRSVTPTHATPVHSGAPDVNRPLPPLPDNASVMSVGLASVLGTRPASGYDPESVTRSNSSESRPGPTTPRTGEWAPASPMVHGLDLEDKRRRSGWPGVLGGPVQTGKAENAGKKGKAPKADRRVSLLPLGEDEEDEVFSVDRTPSKRRLWEAGTHFLRDEEGKLVCFGDLFPRYDQDNTKPPPSHTKAEVASLRSQNSLNQAHLMASTKSEQGHQAANLGKPAPRTVVFFLRFFWCGQCQDYTAASIAKLDPVALEKANIRIVIISCGNWKHIKPYRRLFNCSFPIYVDGGRQLYHLMGKSRSIAERLQTSLKQPMANPGNVYQLGGEFILEPGFECSFAHRMTTRSDHMEAADVVRLAGCDSPTLAEVQEHDIAEEQQAEMDRLQKEMQEWREGRESELDRMRRKKAERRGQHFTPISQASNASRLDLGLDEEDLPDHLKPSQPHILDSPAFGTVDLPSSSNRRESVASVATIQARKESVATLPAEVEESPEADSDSDEELEAELDDEEVAEEIEADLRGTDDIEDLEAEMADQFHDEEVMNQAFQKALKIEEKAKERFEKGSWGESKSTGRVRGEEV